MALNILNTKKKKRKNSKAIGGDYEREIAKRLSKWFTGSEDELVCWRASHSGSVGTLRKKKGQSGENVSGDFQCLDSKYEEFFKHFHCDSKSLGDVHLLINNPSNEKSNQLFNEWKKVCGDAESKLPLMFVKARNDRKIYEFILLPEYIKVRSNYYIYYGLQDPEYNCILLSQEDFFKCNEWKFFLERNLNE